MRRSNRILQEPLVFRAWRRPMTARRVTNILRYKTRRHRQAGENNPFILSILDLRWRWLWDFSSPRCQLREFFRWVES